MTKTAERWNLSGIINCDNPKDFRIIKENTIRSFYLAGSLRNANIPEFANQLASEGYEVFSVWFSPGPEADNYGRNYSKARGRSYREFLDSYAMKNVFEFDRFHMNRCDALVVLMPAGRSAHLELGVTLGQGKPGFIVFEE